MPRRFTCHRLVEMSSSSTGSVPRSASPAPSGLYAETRADDLVVRVIRELMRRNPDLPPERIDEVAVAATTQIGDQGLTSAGLPRCWRGCRSPCPAIRWTACARAR